MKKKQRTPQDIYKRNQKRAKTLKIISPIVFWVCIALSIVCLICAIKNSFGNIAEISRLLDKKGLTGVELEENYKYLITKYGEWVIGTGGSGFTITFINIPHALFSGLMITSCILSVIFLIAAYVLGKWVLPHISAQILIDNQDMVNMTVLENADKKSEKKEE